ncbi:MAG: hypothetical protein ACODAA_03110 [Gemmatimonadota bacterium]
MRNAHRPLARMMIPVLVAFLVTAGCADADAPPDGEAEPETAAETAGDGNEETPGGTITVGDESWTVVADRQCAVRGGQLASIWGHLAEHPDREVTIDHDPASGLVEAKIEAAEGGVLWRSGGDDVEMTIDGNTVSGEGMFGESYGPAETEGSFEVTC